MRDEGLLTLMEALRKMTVEPARRLEARVPGMPDQGRLRVGADADMTIFDPATVIDRSTYEDATIPADIRKPKKGGVISTSLPPPSCHQPDPESTCLPTEPLDGLLTVLV